MLLFMATGAEFGPQTLTGSNSANCDIGGWRQYLKEIRRMASRKTWRGRLARPVHGPKVRLWPVGLSMNLVAADVRRL
jgi:hypothetical protein